MQSMMDLMPEQTSLTAIALQAMRALASLFQRLKLYVMQEHELEAPSDISGQPSAQTYAL